MAFKAEGFRGGFLSPLAELAAALLRSLRPRYTTLVVLPLLLIAILSVVAEQMGLSSLVLKQRRSEVQNDAVFHAGQYDSYFLSAERAAEMIASLLAKHPQLPEDELYSLLEATLHANPSFYGAGIAYVPDGYPGRRLFGPGIVRQTDRIQRVERTDYADGKWDWFSGPLKSLRTHWTDPYKAENARVVTCSVPFLRDGKVLGVATIDFELTSLREHVESHRTTAGEFQVVTSSGNIVFGGEGNVVEEARRTGQGMDYALKLTNHEGPRTLILQTPQGPVVAAYVPLSGPDWSFGSQVSERDLMAADHTRLVRSALAQGLMVVGAGLIVWIVLGWVVASLVTLREEMEDFCRGRAPQVIPPDTKDEVGDLQRAFFTVTELIQDTRPAKMPTRKISKEEL